MRDARWVNGRPQSSRGCGWRPLPTTATHRRGSSIGDAITPLSVSSSCSGQTRMQCGWSVDAAVRRVAATRSRRPRLDHSPRGRRPPVAAAHPARCASRSARARAASSCVWSQQITTKRRTPRSPSKTNPQRKHWHGSMRALEHAQRCNGPVSKRAYCLYRPRGTQGIAW